MRSEYGSLPILPLLSSTGVANVLHALRTAAVFRQRILWPELYQVCYAFSPVDLRGTSIHPSRLRTFLAPSGVQPRRSGIFSWILSSEFVGSMPMLSKSTILEAMC